MPKSMAAQCRARLSVLKQACELEDLRVPGFGFHPLHGKPKRYAIAVNGRWRITFEWREDVLPALGLSVSAAARLLRVSRQTLHRLLAGTIGVSPELTARLGKLCGNGLWIRMQAEYALWKAERRMAHEIERIPTCRVVNG